MDNMGSQAAVPGGPEEAPKASVTVEDLDKLVQQWIKLDDELQEIAERSKAKGKEIMSLKGRISTHLVELGRKEFDSPLGKVAIKQRWSRTLPKSPEDRHAFFEWCKEKGIFENVITVHSGTYNATVAAEERAAEARGEGMTFSVPGVPAATLFEDVKLARSKK